MSGHASPEASLGCTRLLEGRLALRLSLKKGVKAEKWRVSAEVPACAVAQDGALRWAQRAPDTLGARL
jgi:hypothetical protein